MEFVVQFMLLFVATFFGTTANSITAFISEEKTMYSDNLRCSCSASVDEQAGLAKGQHIIKHDNVSSLWLPIIKLHLGGWKWINAVELDTVIYSLLNDSPDDKECAVLELDSKNDHLSSECCFEKHPFICQGKEAQHQGQPFRFGGTYYHVYTNVSLSWYAAKTFCQKYNQSLLILPVKRELYGGFKDLLFKTLHDVGKMQKKEIWIGLRKRDYFTESCEQRKVVANYFWHEFVNCSVTKYRCITLSRSNDQIRWTPEPCSSTHQHLCIRRTLEEDEASNHPLTDKGNKREEATYTIITGALAALAILVSIVTFILLMKYLRRNNWARSRSRHLSFTEREVVPLKELRQRSFSNPN